MWAVAWDGRHLCLPVMKIQTSFPWRRFFLKHAVKHTLVCLSVWVLLQVLKWNTVRLWLSYLACMPAVSGLHQLAGAPLYHANWKIKTLAIMQFDPADLNLHYLSYFFHTCVPVPCMYTFAHCAASLRFQGWIRHHSGKKNLPPSSLLLVKQT